MEHRKRTPDDPTLVDITPERALAPDPPVIDPAEEPPAVDPADEARTAHHPTGEPTPSPASTPDPSPDPSPDSSPSPSPARLRPSIRTRVLGFAAVLLIGATALGLLVQRAVLLQRLDRQVNEMLEQERTELEALIDGRNPATGEPFGTDVAAIFETFLERNVPSADEVFIAYVDGRLYGETLAPYRLGNRPELVARWAEVERTERREVDTEEGPVRYLAIPLDAGADAPSGVFVIAIFLDGERRAIDDDLRVQAVVVGIIIAIAMGIAWITAGRLLRPLRNVTDTARAISESDLSRRIPVESDDEIGDLTRTFNQMLDRLEEAFATQRSFVDDAGHELRTPITIIMGQLEVMGDDPAEREATLAIVNDELHRMARMVEDLLLLAKAEQPDFIQREPVELQDFTTEVLAKARTLGERGWRLDRCADAVVEIDPQRVTQAMLNLARNAVEHTDPGTPIGIGSEVDGDVLRIWVRDQGSGIEPEDQARIFDRFSRGRGARRRSEGAGLGLAIVTAIAARHRGQVLLTSAPGLGSRFELEIPVGEIVPGPPSSGAVPVILDPTPTETRSS